MTSIASTMCMQRDELPNCSVLVDKHKNISPRIFLNKQNNNNMGNRQARRESSNSDSQREPTLQDLQDIQIRRIFERSASASLSGSLDFTHVYSFGQCDKAQSGRGEFKEGNTEIMPFGAITELHREATNQLSEKERNELDSNVLLDVKCVAAGRSHFLLVTNSNKLFSLGYNNYSQCGVPSDEEYITRLREVKIPNISSVDLVAAGWFHSIVVCDKNKIFAAGHCYFDQTFDVKVEGGFSKSNRLDFLQRDNSRVSSASASTFSSSLLVDGWKIYACGEMNANANSNYLVPGCEVFKNNPLKTYKHSDKGLVALTESGLVYFADKAGPFRIIMQDITTITPSHMYDTTFFLKDKETSLTECTLGPMNIRSNVMVSALVEKYGAENIQIFCGYCFYYLVVNKKKLFSIQGNELNEIFDLDGINTHVNIKDVIASSDCSYVIFERVKSTASETLMKTRLLQNAHSDLVIITQADELYL